MTTMTLTTDAIAVGLCFSLSATMGITAIFFIFSQLRGAIGRGQKLIEAWKVVATHLNFLLFSMAFFSCVGSASYAMLLYASRELRDVPLAVLTILCISAFKVLYTGYSYLRSRDIVKQAGLASVVLWAAMLNAFLHLSQFLLCIVAFYFVSKPVLFYVSNPSLIPAAKMVRQAYYTVSLISMITMVLFDSILLFVFSRSLSKSQQATGDCILSSALHRSNEKLNLIARWGVGTCVAHVGAMVCSATSQLDTPYANLLAAAGMACSGVGLGFLFWMRRRIEAIQEWKMESAE